MATPITCIDHVWELTNHIANKWPNVIEFQDAPNLDPGRGIGKGTEDGAYAMKVEDSINPPESELGIINSLQQDANWENQVNSPSSPILQVSSCEADSK